MTWLPFLPRTHLHRRETEAHGGCEVRSIAKKQSLTQTLSLVNGIAAPLVTKLGKCICDAFQFLV